MASEVVTSETRAEYMAAKLAKTPIPEIKAEDPPTADAKKEVVEQPEDGDKPKKKHTIDERLSKMAEQRKEAEEKAERLEKELAEIRKANAPKDAKPNPADFTEAEKYADALADWKFGQKVKEEAEKTAKAKEAERQDKVAKAWNKRYSAAAKEIEDFEEVIMGEKLVLQPDVINAVFESEVGPQIHYFLSGNREEAEKINDMSAAAALRYIGRLEARIEAENEAKREKAERKAEREERPKAPAPIATLNGSNMNAGLGIVDTKGNVTGSYQDYKAARKQGKIS